MVDAFKRVAKAERYHDSWIRDCDLVYILLLEHGLKHSDLIVTSELNRALSKTFHFAKDTAGNDVDVGDDDDEESGRDQPEQQQEVHQYRFFFSNTGSNVSTIDRLNGSRQAACYF